MKLIHKVEECAIYESNKHSYASVPASISLNSATKTFLLKITSSSSPDSAVALLTSMSKSLKHVDNHTLSSIKFKALKATPLKSFIEEMHSPLPHSNNMLGIAYTVTLKLLADIGTQLERIRVERGFIIPFFSLEDIVVIETAHVYEGNKKYDEGQRKEEIDSKKSELESEYVFVFMNAEKLMQEPKPNKKDLMIDVPLKVNKQTSFLPAELPESALKRLPMRVTTTSWYYSLSALCIYALLQHKFKNGEDDIEQIGRPFLHTSLYFCLKRCLKLDPEERVLLYV
jgi:hypothetical protein